MATVALAAVLFAGGVVSLELHARSLGYVASVIDNKQLWILERARVSDSSATTIAIAGTSRFAIAIDLETLRQRLPGSKPVQLSIVGKNGIAVLRDLANDPAFRGIALLDMPEHIVESKHRWAAQRWVDAYQERWSTPGLIAEEWLSARVQARLALLRYASKPEPPAQWMRLDRSEVADVVSRKGLTPDVVARRRADNAKTLAKRHPVWPEKKRRFLEDVASIEPFIEAIEARGGKVAFVRMPTKGPRTINEEEVFYPREHYWDVFAARTRAATIHYRDFPAMAEIECPDDSHIDTRDAPKMTNAIVDALVERGVFPR